MTWHLAAYRAAVDNTVNVSLAGLVDPVLTRSATSALYILPQEYQLVAAWAGSATLIRARLNSPTLRQINPPYIRPMQAALLPVAGEVMAWYADQPLKLPALEEIGPEVTANPVATEPVCVLLWITDGLRRPPPGQVITVRATATITAVAGAWTLGSFVFEQSLPSGNYAMVGSECIGTTCIAHRWAFPNQMFRPGGLGYALNDTLPDFRRNTRMIGEMGRFLNTAPPLLEILCDAADTAQELYVQLVPLSGQLGSMMG